MATSRARRNRIVLAATLVAVVGLAGGAYIVRQAQLRRSMDRWLKEGTAAYERGDYQAALDNLNEYVSRDRTNVDVLLDFADSRMRIPSADDAHLAHSIRVVQAALALEPDSLEGRTLLMKLYYAAGYTTEAREAAEQVLQLDQGSNEARRIRIRTLLATGENQAAIAEAVTLAEMAPDDLDTQREALAFMAIAGAPASEAEAFVDGVAERFEPQLGVELMRIAAGRMRLRETTEDSPAFREVLEQLVGHLTAAAGMEVHSPDEAEALVVALRTGLGDQHSLARDTLQRLMEEPRFAPRLAALAARSAWTRNRQAEAGKLIVQHVPDLEGAEPQTLGWLALSPVPEAGEARRILEASSDDRSRPWVELARANEHLEADRPLEAAKVLQRLTIINDEDAAAMSLYLGGMCDAALGETARAASQWKRLVDGARWEVARTRLIAAYHSLGRLEEARQYVGDARGALPLMIATELAETTPTPQHAANAVDHAEWMLANGEASASTRALAGRAFLAAGETDRAHAVIDDLLAAEEIDQPLHVDQLARRLHERGQQQLGDRLDQKLAAHADQPTVAWSQAVAEAAAGRPEEGRRLLEERLAGAAPEARRDWEWMLIRYLGRTSPDEAADMLLALSAAEPDDIRTQQQVLESEIAWTNPEALGPVIERLAAATGERGIQWRVYRAKRELRLLDPQSPELDRRATGVLLALAGVLREDPQNLEALEVCAEAAAMLQDHARTADYLLRAVDRDPGDVARRIRLVNALTRAGRVEEARQHVQDLATVEISSPELLRQRASTLERYGLSDLAQADWERLAGGGSIEAEIHLAYQLAGQGQLDRANETIEEIAAREDLSPAALRDLATYYGEWGTVDRGLEVLQRLPEDSELGRRSEVVARYLFTMREATPELARELEALAKESGSGAVWAQTALAYQAAYLKSDMERVVRAGLEAAPGAPELVAVQRIMDSAGSPSPAAYLGFIRAVLLTDASPEAEAVSGLIDRYLAGALAGEELVSGLRQVLADAPLASSAWIGLAAAQYAAGQKDGMRTTLLDGIDAFPTHAAMARIALELFLNSEMPSEALTALRAFEERTEPGFSRDLRVGSILLHLGRAQEALPYLQPYQAQIAEAREERPADALTLASALASSGDVGGADRLLSPLIGVIPEGVGCYIAASRYIRDETSRREWLTRATLSALESGNEGAYLDLVNSWWDFARTTGAEADIREFARVAEAVIERAEEDRPEYHIAAGAAFDRLGEPALAVPHYRALVAMLPDEPALRNNLAYALLQSGGEPSEAAAEAERAVALAQTSGSPPAEIRSYLDTQAQALLAAGEPQRAAELYREALSSDDRWPLGLLGLGEALVASGQRDEARAQLTALEAVGLSADLSPRASALRDAIEEH